MIAVDVPKNKISLVLGARGAQHQFMQSRLGVRIAVEGTTIKIQGARATEAAAWVRRIVDHVDSWVPAPPAPLFVDAECVMRAVFASGWTVRSARAWVRALPAGTVVFFDINHDSRAVPLASELIAALVRDAGLEPRFCTLNVAATMMALRATEALVTADRAPFDFLGVARPLVFGAARVRDGALELSPHRLHALQPFLAGPAPRRLEPAAAAPEPAPLDRAAFPGKLQLFFDPDPELFEFFEGDSSAGMYARIYGEERNVANHIYVSFLWARHTGQPFLADLLAAT